MNAQTADSDTPDTRSTSGWLRLAHILCVAVALLTIGLFVAGLPLYYDVLRTPCAAAPCEEDQVTVE